MADDRRPAGAHLGVMTTTLDRYRILGTSGLRVSPLGLGTMTFGTDWGWGADEAEARRIFDRYVDRGGNFIDTANAYTNGSAERFVGKLVDGRRDRFVIATKYTAAMDPSDPNAGGNHKKSLVRSVDASLARLGTDYVDLLYLHVWDGTTPIDELARALDDLVRTGKVLHVAMSNVPAWQIARLHMLADLRGLARPCAVELEYNLIERTAERDMIPMARELGLAIVPWSPLASGVLAAKYTARDLDAGAGVASASGTRKNVAAAQGALNPRGLAIAGAVVEVAKELGVTPAQVALAWVLAQPGVTSPIIGARTLAQLDDNLGALAIDLAPAHLARLAAASTFELGYPHQMIARDMTRAVMFGSTKIEGITA
jgi:aryl-alcohol dehydrogenase-like predicted oxidoreductase